MTAKTKIYEAEIGREEAAARLLAALRMLTGQTWESIVSTLDQAPTVTIVATADRLQELPFGSTLYRRLTDEDREALRRLLPEAEHRDMPAHVTEAFELLLTSTAVKALAELEQLAAGQSES